jgi:hypothetical protein
VESVSQALKLKGGSCAEHDLDSACENMERLYCLMLDMLVLDECRCFLSAAEQDIHYLLRIH